MKIKSLEIANFRSIKELYLEPSGLCALIGPNGSGKTNILKAIDLVIGEGWTTKAKVARELFNDPEKPIKIEIKFDEAVEYPNPNGFPDRVTSVELEMRLRPELSVTTTRNGGEKFFYQDHFKKRCHFVFIPSDRQLSDELRVSQWTMLGKLMKTVYESYVSSYNEDEERLRSDFKQKMAPAKQFLEQDFSQQRGHVTFQKFILAFKKYCKLNSAGFANDFEPILDIYNLNWFYKTLQITVQEEGSEIHFDSEEVGAGMQNLLVLSIFQTYSELMGGNVILGIEEPEIYLYPQAQRSLYKNFISIASAGTQLFYTTHNPNFVDALRPDDIALIRKTRDSGTEVLEKNPYFNAATAEKERHRIYTQFNPDRNELFFSKRVLFVEGASDKLLFSTLCEQKWGIDLDSCGFSIISCGGKGGVNYFVGVARLIGLEDFFAVWDEDNPEGYNPSKDFLPDTLKHGKGLQLAGNLEIFLGITGSDKVKAAFEWAKGVDVNRIPADFEQIRKFFSPSQPILIEEAADVSDDDLPF